MRLNAQSVCASLSDLYEMGFRLYFSMPSSLPQKWGGQLTLLAPHSEKWGGDGLPGPPVPTPMEKMNTYFYIIQCCIVSQNTSEVNI